MSDQQETLSIGSLLVGLWRAKWKIVVPTLLAFIASVAFVMTVTPSYRASARVLLEDRQTPFNRPEAENRASAADTIDELTVRSQVEALTSIAVVEPVVGELQLDKRGEFNPLLRDSLVRMIRQMLGLAKPLTPQIVDEYVLNRFYDNYSVYQIDKSRVIEIEFSSEDPVIAAEVPNRIAASFIAMQKLARNDATSDARAWLAEQVESLRGRVQEAESNVERFRASNELFHVAGGEGQGSTTLPTRQLAELSSSLSEARARRSEATARARLIREALKAGNAMNATDVLNSQVIQRLIEQKAALQAQIAELSSTLLPRHPRIRELNAQAAGLDQQIRREAEHVVRGLENDARIAAEREIELQAGLDALKKNAAASNESEVQLRALEREAAAARQLLEIYLARYSEAAGRENGVAANVRILSPATVSTTPYFPRKGPFVALSTLAVLVFVCGINILSQLAGAAAATPRRRHDEDDSLRDYDFDFTLPETAGPADISSPRVDAVRTARDIPAPQPPAPPVAEAAGEEPDVSRRILVAPLQPADAPYAPALKLARSYSDGSGRVLLLDCNFGKGGIERHLGLPSGPGLADLIAGRAHYEDILHRDTASRLHLIGAGRADGDPALIAHSPLMRTVIEALGETYSTIVMVAGPLSHAAEVLSMARFAGEAMLVVGDGVGEAAVARACQRLSEVGVGEIVPFRPAPAKAEMQTA